MQENEKILPASCKYETHTFIKIGFSKLNLILPLDNGFRNTTVIGTKFIGMEYPFNQKILRGISSLYSFQNQRLYCHTLLGQLKFYERPYLWLRRVSTGHQNLDRQSAAFKKYGCGMIYNEKMPGTKQGRLEPPLFFS